GGSASGGKKDVITSEQYVVAEERPTTCPFCKQCEMKQSEDVLDTWFSSALWPFAGRSAADLATYYPGNLVSNARDILNLWDARMIFSGLEFMGAAPFHDVLIHGTIQTKDGKRMSKSLGTGIDPLTYIEKFGADATRFAVLWQSSGQDIRWDESAAVAGRKFANKIWNAARFVQGITNNGSTSPSAVSSGPNGSPSLEPPRAESRDKQPTTNNTKPKTEASIKILEALAQAKASVARDLEQFEFSQALRTAYDFFWHEVCDTYIEVAKRELMDPALAEQTSATLLHVLRGSLKLLHPFMPFVTEELWSALPDYKPDHLLMVERW
ncbi:MAG: class I tRNA ligase family protein, partial [bacterium]|nr:class I tRNA ligase family protein [bacterium]